MNWADKYIASLQNRKVEERKTISAEDYKRCWIATGESLYAEYEFDNVQELIFNSIISTRKGIIFAGKPGIGKSVAMDIIHKLNVSMGVTSCNVDVPEMEFMYRVSGAKILEPYLETRILLLNDIGKESDLNDYGTDRNIVAELLYFRYRRFQTMQYRTYCTCNINKDRINQRYGEVLANRFHEMFAFVELNGIDRRKSK